MLRFGVVGVSGVVVNQGLLMLLHGSLGLALWAASAIAIEISVVNNFFLNNQWTWRYDHQNSLSSWLRKAMQYHVAVGASALIGNLPILMLLVHVFAVDYRIANLIGISVASLLNFVANELWVFRKSHPSSSS
jgi:dolichol-phosphate mannosyltransferase